MPGIKEMVQHLKKRDIVGCHVEMKGPDADGTPGHFGLAFLYKDGSQDTIIFVGKTNKSSTEQKSIQQPK